MPITKTTTREEIIALPDKMFFITMLVKDIELIRAILDLVDNSVDAARVSAKTRNTNLSRKSVKIEANELYFQIFDNCGGMTRKAAIEYAFRFGFSKRNDRISNTIGHFGIGMKRSLFKMGKMIHIFSKTKNEEFYILIDVEAWKDNSDEASWVIPFKSVSDCPKVLRQPDPGLYIRVDKLYDHISSEFKSSSFAGLLETNIARTHSIPIRNGLSISVNSDVPIPQSIPRLVSDRQFSPINLKKVHLLPNGKSIKIHLVAGVHRRDWKLGGWYIYCNDRLIMGADESVDTIWRDMKIDRIPKYHPDYAFFRGYLFIEAEDQDVLPWNTTKTGLDINSLSYKYIRMQMIESMRPIIRFLKDVAQEKEVLGTNEFDKMIEKAKDKEITRLALANTFKHPSVQVIRESEDKMVNIQYKRPKKQVDRVKALFKIDSNVEVGEATFDAIYEKECEE